MISSRAFANRTVAIFGLARTGLGAVRALVAGGTRVIAWDDNSNARDLGGQEGAELMPWREWPWENIAALILSPGVPLTHPAPHRLVTRALAAGVPVLGDVELFLRARPAGTRVYFQVMLSVWWSSMGTRHSKCSPKKKPLGHRHTRPTVQAWLFSSLSCLMRR